MSTVPQGRSWPPRLRALLRARLATSGMAAIPKNMVIRYEDGPSPCIEIRHRPCATERCSVHDKVTGFDGSHDAISRFLDVATLHAQAMHRRAARMAALERAGHDADSPPLHAVEAHPLIVLARRLMDEGKGGISAVLEIEDGVMLARPLTLTLDGARVTMATVRESQVRIAGEWPEAVVATMGGRRLDEVLSLPSTRDGALDDAVHDLVVASAEGLGGADPELVLRLRPAPAVALANTPPDEDGAWKDMVPRPMT